LNGEPYEVLRKLLVDARKNAGLTQAELAEKLGRLQSFVSKYERGERRLDVVEFRDVAIGMNLEPASFLAKFYKSLQ
jgi:transcriptional regulator with XRE-family HTH domain